MNGVAVYGIPGPPARPVLAFPAEKGDAGEFERHGVIGAVGDEIGAGRVKLYCVDSYDAESWSNPGIPLEERARRHGVYESWVLDEVVPFIRWDCGGATEIIVCGVSLGAYHAANFALKRADVFPLAICLSGNYDPSSWDAWGERGDAAYFNNPMDYVQHLGGRGASPRCSSRKASGASSTSGVTTSRTTGRRGGPSLPTICDASSE